MCAAFAKSERLSCRITPEGKRLLEHVAARHGMNISEYVVNLAIDIASQELTEEIVIRIPTEEWSTFLVQLEADTEPNAKLIEAARTFAKGTFSGDTYHVPD